jgi:hypothetical protein
MKTEAIEQLDKVVFPRTHLTTRPGLRPYVYPESLYIWSRGRTFAQRVSGKTSFGSTIFLSTQTSSKAIKGCLGLPISKQYFHAKGNMFNNN